MEKQRRGLKKNDWNIYRSLVEVIQLIRNEQKRLGLVMQGGGRSKRNRKKQKKTKKKFKKNKSHKCKSQKHKFNKK